MRQEITQIITETVRNFDFFLYEIKIKGDARKPVISVFVDTEEGITIGQCESLSRELHNKFENNERVPENYRLDVSSPGITSELKHHWQFKKYTGREMSVITNDETIKNFDGILENAEENCYVFLKGETKIEVNPDAIKKAKLKIKWS